MDNTMLIKWANLLLDTGKRNNLINFKDTKATSVDVLFPDIESIFSKIENSVSVEVYDPKFAEDEDDITLFSKNTPKLSQEEYLQTYSHLCSSRQFLVFNQHTAPITAIKNIHKKAKSAIDETGINICYIAFGFINWTEEKSTSAYHAPILLAPIYFSNESRVEPYYINAEDDVILNPTFSYKLESTYNIKLPQYSDEGLSSYLDTIGSIVEKLGWSVTPKCKIGLFSFQKINMYQDIIQNADTILENENILRLLGQSVTEDSPQDSTAYVLNNPIVELHNVVDADSSQIEAIEMAKSGKSFILQGPPGTGKSQTITNIIAECLNDGKKILFVSEKLAALKVVFENLRKAGLSEFCLELHSNKANKKEVVNNLLDTLNAAKVAVLPKADAEISAKEKAQQELNCYEQQLHCIRNPIGKSLYELFNDYSACREYRDLSESFIFSSIDTKKPAFINASIDALTNYCNLIPTLGYNYKNNCWYGFINQDTSFISRKELKQSIRELAEHLDELLPITLQLSEFYGISLNSFDDLQIWTKFFEIISSGTYLTPALLSKTNANNALSKIIILKSQAKTIQDLRNRIDETYDNGIYKLDGSVYHKKLEKLYGNFIPRLFHQEYRQLTSDLRLARKSGKKLSYAEALSISSILSEYQEKLTIFSQEEAEVKSALSSKYIGVDTDWDTLSTEIAKLTDFYAHNAPHCSICNYTADKYQQEVTNFKQFSDKLNKYQKKCESQMRSLQCSFDIKKFNIETENLLDLQDRLNSFLANFDSLENWSNMLDVLHDISNLKITKFLDVAIENNIPAQDIIGSFKKTFYFQLIDNLLHGNPMLRSLSRVIHDKAVKTFSEKDRQQFVISKEQIRARLTSLRPSTEIVSPGSSIAKLRHEGAKKRKLKSIRTLLSEIGDLIQRIKPCFLMSPLSVSTYLNSDSAVGKTAVTFDVVIFDEASQVFPQDAIGAIYRAKQLIIVGDEKQMPPSNFFNNTVETEDIEDESEDISDYESILDVCRVNFTEKRLLWHYRSRYEQLIAFSNKNFYKNGLITFPSSTTDHVGIGVDYYYVNGQFDRQSKTNIIEAQCVVDLIFKNIDLYPNRSLGIVAFNIAQQELIDRLLSKRRQEDTSKESFFRSDANEPFFIKNLETVQGDERDTIIFSVAYAKDAQGRFIHNFGPLNRKGGERRLNVAVTRAKYNVQLVASIHHTDIDLSRSSAEGTRLLKEYLDFAENGQIALQRTINPVSSDQFDSEFELEVCDFLRQQGYTVDTQVGCSNYRIDLGLRKPDTSDYVLAIECDGASYHSSKNARDRDRLRQEVLERMGWKFYRIWSTEWFKNNAIERKHLLEAVEYALANHENSLENGTTAEPELPSVQAVSEFIEPVKESYEFAEYKISDDYKLIHSARGFMPLVKAIVENESPVSEEWLLKRTCSFFGREKVTSFVQSEYNRKIARCSDYGIIRRNGFLYLKNQKDFNLRIPNERDIRREIKNIAPEELAAGIYEILKQNISSEKDDLYRFITKMLGFSRMGDSIYAQLEQALHLLADKITINGTTLTIKD